jgi:superfamily II DNA/RNA helicase
MDETYVKPIEEMDISPQEWRSMHDITVRGHGANASATSFPAPYLKFSNAPFCEAIQKSFKQAGFDKPTHIQSQVW